MELLFELNLNMHVPQMINKSKDYQNILNRRLLSYFISTKFLIEIAINYRYVIYNVEAFLDKTALATSTYHKSQ